MAADVPKPARFPIPPPALARRAAGREKPILLHYEQGLGDTVQFIRFAPQVKERGGAGLGLSVSPPWFGWCRFAPGVDRVFDGTAGFPDFPVHTGLDERAQHSGHERRTLPRDPYLRADKATIDYWRPLVAQAFGVADLDSVFKIGIAWQGSPKNHIDRWRSFPLAHFARLSRLAGSSSSSACKRTDGIDQMATRPDQFPIAVLDPEVDERRDFLDTAAHHESGRPRGDSRNSRRPPRWQPGRANLGRDLPCRRLALDGQRRDLPLVPQRPHLPSDHVTAIGMASFARSRKRLAKELATRQF